MTEVLPRDVLLRVGGRTLHRTGFLAAMGAGRGYVEVKETFARAGVKRFRDRDVSNGLVALGRKAEAGKIAVEYPGELSGLVDAQGLPYCGPRLEGARTQLVASPENFGAWTAINVTPTAGQADPFGGTAAYKLDATVGVDNRIQLSVAGFTAGTRAVLGFLRADPTSAQSNIKVTDSGGGAIRHHVRITWTAGVPSLSTISGTGTLFGVAPWGAGWYAILINADNVAASDIIMIYPAATGGTGTVYAFGVNAWNSLFPSNYQAPGESASVADSMSLPINVGPGADLTVLARVARPVWADAVGAIGTSPRIVEVGTAVGPHLDIFGDSAVRNWVARISDGVSFSQDAASAIPAGATQAVIGQFKTLKTNPLNALDVGSGLSAFTDGSVAGFSAFGNQVVRLGGDTTLTLFGVILDCIVARGQRTLNEMLAIP